MTMKKLLLTGMLTLTIFLNGCAFSVPWWLLLKNEPSSTRYTADRLITEQKPVRQPAQSENTEKSEMAKSPESREPSAH